ncbi:MAG: hypothetical protein A2Y28_04155 [Chlamydiae bacterium GWC2_50_10]|nr:MAG: hypothetical protein A2Y28_04155 [Chlamydiae bacterium GWC2_50_10]OGN63615.1 MAG: hypothetical protein A3E26_00735 [Chlamydiae bacterium RIFCSPHIGHO2_12_FULL_49_32]OGN71101.1 MAG: hypothetical protein A3I15_05505 [Chlamydiae bacterium RIFCSPLOWO2_02_FULL_49_12]OGN73374.1 MAG: hypothetical protein A3G30_02720 [Chlamydiae bacterium RIFCSPLOWO2_12_FULL_49_12]HCJ83278.1 hypothetical protein [Parachlamydiales bacterium]
MDFRLRPSLIGAISQLFGWRILVLSCKVELRTGKNFPTRHLLYRGEKRKIFQMKYFLLTLNRPKI